MKEPKKENKQDAQLISIKMTIDSDGATHTSETNPLAQVAADNSIPIDANARSENGSDQQERLKLSNSLQVSIAKIVVKQEGNELQKKKNDGGSQLNVDGSAQVDVESVNTPRSQRYMRRARKHGYLAAEEVELIRQSMAEKKIGEVLIQAKVEKDCLSYSNFQSNDLLSHQQPISPAVKKAHQSLLTRLTLRQLREVICVRVGLTPPGQSNNVAPVRRQQRERREVLRAAVVPVLQHRVTADNDLKLSFPFLTMQVGDYYSELPFGMPVHEQQQGRMNSLTLNTCSKCLIYEFTLLDQNNNPGYALWTLTLSKIMAIHLFDHLVCMKLNAPPMQVVSFTGTKSNLGYDLTNGQRVRSPFHYFHLIGPAQDFFDALVRCDATHFAAILLSEEEFFAGADDTMCDGPSMTQENPLHDVVMNSNDGDQLDFDELSSGTGIVSPIMGTESPIMGTESPIMATESPIMATESPSFVELLDYVAMGHLKPFENVQSQNIDKDLDI